MVLVLFLVFNYLVLPQLAGARRALDAPSGVKPWLLVLALGLELGALVAYAAFMRVTLPPGEVARYPGRGPDDASGPDRRGRGRGAGASNRTRPRGASRSWACSRCCASSCRPSR